MNEAIIAGREPAVEKLEPGTYYWCSCGRSKNQPLCDGSHQGTAFEPLQFSIEETTTVALCQCKATSTPPFCDGTHNKL
ncbi:MAG: CDGSH iron-sulfur domain-containing protein [Gammaproteobacteria bacterium]|nr:CDGSH iron-sulfur domain-containing protein [Gammaproteobacteria bacterium]